MAYIAGKTVSCYSSVNFKYFKTLLAILLFTLPISLLAAVPKEVYVDRYLTVANKPTLEQSDLLYQNFHIRFPPNIRTIGNAIHYLLKNSGYALADKSLSFETKYMLNRPLPHVQRNFGPMPLREGLITLAGNTFQLLVDPIHRLISFRVKNIYSGYYQLHNTK